MINLYSALRGVVAIYCISLPTGYAIIHSIFSQKLYSNPFFIRLPIYIAFGISLLIPMYLAVAFFKLTMLTPISILLLSIAYIILSKKFQRGEKKKLNKKQFKSVKCFDKNFHSIFFILTAIYFFFVVSFMKWPPAGDIITGTGPLVSLIMFSNKLPIKSSPILILYPPGFHVATATFNTLLKIYPAEAIFLMGASIITLIPPLIYSLTYIATQSKIFSTIAFFSPFLIHPSGHLEKWVVGYFFNGLYPCLNGFLSILTFTNILVLISQDSSEKDWHQAKKNIITSLIVSFSLIFTYPPFALLTMTYAVILLVIYFDLVEQQFKQALKYINSATKILIIMVILVVLVFLFIYVLQKRYVFEVLIAYLKGSYFPGGSGVGEKDTIQAYIISPYFFLDNLNGISIPIAYLAGAYLTLKWKKIDVPLFFLITATLVLISLNDMIYQFIFYILPNRSVIILSLLSCPLILTAAEKIIKERKFFSSRKMTFGIFNRKIVVKPRITIHEVVIVAVVISVFTPSLYGYSSMQQLESWSWFSHQPWFSDDLAALEWINKNIGTTDLILNDASFASNYLWSLSIKNLTHHPWTQHVYEDQFNDLQRVWQNPRDMQYMQEAFKKHDIRYVFSTSEWGYCLYGKRHGYYAKPYSPSQYAEIFNSYFFLKPVFRSGSTNVYEVFLTDIELNKLRLYDLYSLTANTFWNRSDAWHFGGTVGSPLLSDIGQKIDVPSGNFKCWGIYHDTKNAKEWPETTRYFSIYVHAKFPLGLSFLIWDTNGNYARFDFVMTGGVWETIFLDIQSPSECYGIIDMTKIKGFALVTGFSKPYPEPENSIMIKNIGLYQLG